MKKKILMIIMLAFIAILFFKFDKKTYASVADKVLGERDSFHMEKTDYGWDMVFFHKETNNVIRKDIRVTTERSFKIELKGEYFIFTNSKYYEMKTPAHPNLSYRFLKIKLFDKNTNYKLSLELEKQNGVIDKLFDVIDQDYLNVVLKKEYDFINYDFFTKNKLKYKAELDEFYFSPRNYDNNESINYYFKNYDMHITFVIEYKHSDFPVSYMWEKGRTSAIRILKSGATGNYFFTSLLTNNSYPLNLITEPHLQEVQWILLLPLKKVANYEIIPDLKGFLENEIVNPNIITRNELKEGENINAWYKNQLKNINEKNQDYSPIYEFAFYEKSLIEELGKITPPTDFSVERKIKTSDIHDENIIFHQYLGRKYKENATVKITFNNDGLIKELPTIIKKPAETNLSANEHISIAWMLSGVDIIPEKAGKKFLNWTASSTEWDYENNQLTVMITPLFKDATPGINAEKEMLTFDNLTLTTIEQIRQKTYLKAYDDNGNDITNLIEIDSDNYTPNFDKLGTYTITFKVTDPHTNEVKTLDITINVKDLTAPINIGEVKEKVITYKQDINFNDILELIILQDKNDPNPTKKIVDKGGYIKGKVGVYNVKIEVSDLYNNKDIVIFKIIVQDNIAPKFSDNVKEGKIITNRKDLTTNDMLNDLTAIDEYDGIVTNRIRVKNVPNMNEYKSYIIEYEVTDKSNNITTYTRTYEIINESVNPFIMTDNNVRFQIDKNLTTEQIIKAYAKLKNINVIRFVIDKNEYELNMATSGQYELKGYIIDNQDKTHEFKLNVIANEGATTTTPTPDNNKKEAPKITVPINTWLKEIETFFTENWKSILIIIGSISVVGCVLIIAYYKITSPRPKNRYNRYRNRRRK